MNLGTSTAAVVLPTSRSSKNDVSAVSPDGSVSLRPTFPAARCVSDSDLMGWELGPVVLVDWVMKTEGTLLSRMGESLAISGG